MRRSEGVVHVQIGKAGQRLGERGVVGFLARVKAQVLQEQEVTGAQPLDRVLDARPERIAGHADRAAQELAQAVGDRLEAVRVVDLAMGSPQVAGHDHGRPMLQQVDEGGDAGPDPGVVGDPAVVQRDVQIGPQEDPFALDVDVANGQFVQRPEPGDRHRRAPMNAARSATRQL